MSKKYFKAQLLFLFSQSLKSSILTIILFITNIWSAIEPYFFGRDFVITITILLMADMIVGIKKHWNIDFSFKLMFHKFVFKIMMTAISTMSAKAIINIDGALNSGILIGAVKLTIALYLFGNIEKNICNLTKNQLCFKWFLDKIKSLINYFQK